MLVIISNNHFTILYKTFTPGRYFISQSGSTVAKLKKFGKFLC